MVVPANALAEVRLHRHQPQSRILRQIHSLPRHLPCWLVQKEATEEEPRMLIPSQWTLLSSNRKLHIPVRQVQPLKDSRADERSVCKLQAVPCYRNSRSIQMTLHRMLRIIWRLDLEPGLDLTLRRRKDEGKGKEAPPGPNPVARAQLWLCVRRVPFANSNWKMRQTRMGGWGLFLTVPLPAFPSFLLQGSRLVQEM